MSPSWCCLPISFVVFPQVFFHRIFSSSSRAVILCAAGRRLAQSPQYISWTRGLRLQHRWLWGPRASAKWHCAVWWQSPTVRRGALRSPSRWDYLPPKYETSLPIIRVKDTQLHRVPEYRMSTRSTLYTTPGNPVRRCICDKAAKKEHTGSLYLCLVLRLWLYIYIYRDIRNNCKGFNNLSYTIHLR